MDCFDMIVLKVLHEEGGREKKFYRFARVPSCKGKKEARIAQNTRSYIRGFLNARHRIFLRYTATLAALTRPN